MEITPLRAGDPPRLGAYRLAGLLGEGGQGTVYLGEDERGERVAVKLLHARFSGDPKARARFAAEVAVAKRVSAFCTARVLDSDVEGDRPYIVSEYIAGPSLSTVLSAEGARHGTDLDRLAIGTMTALAAIHQAGVVHRDFKPANVLLAPDGPRVIDFGIARALDATGTMSSAAVGTPAYMAPEQISGARVGPEADVFAWGATMVYAATARPAFGHDSIPAVMHRILNLPPDLGSLLPPLREIVSDCLSKDPALRPASEQVLAHLLDLAGSLPRPDASGDDSMILTQGVVTAATESARLRIVQAPPAVPPPSSWPPPPPAAPPPAAPPPAAPPPNGQGYATWSPPPGATTDLWTPSKPRKRGKRGVVVPASAGGAALVALVVAGTVLAVRYGNGGHDPPGAPTGRVGGTLQMIADDTYQGDGQLDPGQSYSGTTRFLTKQLFTGLTELDAQGVARNRLATSITPDATCQNWQITVRAGTTFSDGAPVDAAAFARGWARSAAVAAGPAAYLMNDVEGFDTVSAAKTGELSGVKATGSQLSVKLTKPDCEFPTRLADPVFFPVPADAGRYDNTAYNDKPIGNGPFKVETNTKHQNVTLVRNDAWAFGKTKLDKVDIKLAREPAQARVAFTAGATDLAMLGSTTSSGTGGGNDLVKRSLPYTRFIIPLTRRGPLRSKEARLAVSAALDRTKLSAAAQGYYRPALGIVPATIPGGFEKPGVCASCGAPDPDQAKALAARAGLKPGTKVPLHHPNVASYEPVAQAMAEQLRSTLGWNVELKPVEFADLRKTYSGSDAAGLALMSWGPDYPTPRTILEPLLGGRTATLDASSNTNVNGWRNARFDDLLDRAARSPSADTRTSLYKEAEKIALDDLAIIPLMVNERVALVRKAKYVGLALDYDGDPTLASAALK
ncbi:hypothetical protein GCM10022254_49690 [Actinomadura meridiana]|uniref:Protein kinase domain-containing protein n=1 Tax=Actinomadura meridiana TaxID=559626 RepID=A0ABP8CCY5_9ACTN